MNKQSKIFIVYDPGLYGSFIAWWIRNANGNLTKKDLPFNSKYNNAHDALVAPDVRLLSSVQHLQQSLFEDQEKSIYLLHPPYSNSQQERIDLCNIMDQVFADDEQTKLIFMSGVDSECWMFGNMATKISDTWLADDIEELMDIKAWNLLKFNDASDWQKREIISYYLEKAIDRIKPARLITSLLHSSFVKQHSDNLLTVKISDLRDHTEDTLKTVADFCNISVNNKNLSLVKEQFNLTQKYARADQQVNNIVYSVINNKPILWNTLSLIEEAFVQYSLRSFGYELKCFDLNELPTDTQTLLQYLDAPKKVTLPNHIFFTGAPGSRWSGIAQIIESIPGFNTSDRRTDREYTHNTYSGHKGAYFGHGMECMMITNGNYIDSQWSEPGGTKLIKSHEWAFSLTSIRKKKQWRDSWAMLVYRPDMACYSWWHEAGGFNIKYPNYSAYKDSNTMLTEIVKQNAAILEYAQINNCKWEYFTSSWISENFGVDIDVPKVWPDILVTLIK